MIKITDNNGSPKDLIKRFFGTIPIIKVYNSTSLIWSAVKELLQNYSFMYSQTGGGNLSVDVKKGNIKAIKGQTIAWNQSLFSDLSNANNYVCSGLTTASFSANILTVNLKPGSANAFGIKSSQFINTHKYFIKFNGIADCSNMKLGSRISVGNAGYTTDVSRLNKIITINVSSEKNGALWFFDTSNDKTLSFNKILCFDLTLIYGVGNEPTTPEQFEADYQRWFGKPLTYEPYDEGSLKNVMFNGLKTIGFNQWDEEWEKGQYDQTTGEKVSSNSSIRSKSFIQVLPNTIYYFKKIVNATRIFFYDNTQNFIDSISMATANLFTTPHNCYYLTFHYTATTYNNDICINLSWSGVKNGTYEPYEENTISIPTTTMTGKLNGEGESVVIFPDGMKGVNDVHDEIYYVGGKTYAVKRVERVDLGSMEWFINNPTVTTYAMASNSLKNIIKNAEYDTLPVTYILCPKYIVYGRSYITYAGASSGRYANDYAYGIGVSISGQLMIADKSYTDAATFKTAMNGVYLDYELGTPLVYEVDTNLNLKYKADRNGTEEVIPVSGEECVAPIFDVEYT